MSISLKSPLTHDCSEGICIERSAERACSWKTAPAPGPPCLQEHSWSPERAYGEGLPTPPPSPSWHHLMAGRRAQTLPLTLPPPLLQARFTHGMFTVYPGFGTIPSGGMQVITVESVMLSYHLILCRPLFLLLSVFPSIRVFSNVSLLASGVQSVGALASVLPVNFQGWFSLGLTDLISLLSTGLSRVFSSTTVRKHQFLSAQPFLRSNSHIHTWLLEKPSIALTR